MLTLFKVHVEGDINPTRDLQIIDDELRLKDIEYMTETVAKQVLRAILPWHSVSFLPRYSRANSSSPELFPCLTSPAPLSHPRTDCP